MRNVLFILTDDQRYHTIHALGNDEQVVIKRLKKTMQKFRINWDEDQHILGKRYWDKSI